MKSLPLFRRVSMLISLLLVASSAACAAPTPAARTPAAARGACAPAGHVVIGVEPHRPDVSFGKVSFQRTRGAVVHVEAAPGLTEEYLRLSLARGIAATPASDTGCPGDIEGVTVSVASRRDGFLVTFAAPDTERGEEVLRRARAAF